MAGTEAAGADPWESTDAGEGSDAAPVRLTAAGLEAAYYQGEAYMPEITRALAVLTDGQRWAVLGLIEAFQASR